MIKKITIVAFVLVFAGLLVFGAYSVSRTDDLPEYVSPSVGSAKRSDALEAESAVEPPAVTADEVYMAAVNAPDYMDADFFRWCGDCFGDVLWKLLDAFENGYDDIWRDMFGMTEHVVHDMYVGACENRSNVRELSGNGDGSVTLAFGGDVCLADTWENMVLYYERDADLTACVSEGLLDKMRSADLTFVNNEFCYSERGKRLGSKLYTFRAQPSNTSILLEMGVDAVSLANNHVYDFGYDAFCDTLEALDNAGIARVGAGLDLGEAMTPQYFIIGGFKIAIVAASRAEKYIITPAATATEAGVLRTYEPDLFLEVIAEAKANADYVIAYPHWGTENSTVLEQAQTEQARQYIDAGADAVIGSHTHCLQGIEFYNGCPIMYSLGNFWFNYDDGDTALLLVEVNGEGLSFKVVPCTQSNAYTADVSGTDEGARILEYIEGISVNAEIDGEGYVSERVEN